MTSEAFSFKTTVEPLYNEARYNEPRFNEEPVTYNEQNLKARQNYSKICGNEPRYNEQILTVPMHIFSHCIKRIFCPVARKLKLQFCMYVI